MRGQPADQAGQIQKILGVQVFFIGAGVRRVVAQRHVAVQGAVEGGGRTVFNGDRLAAACQVGIQRPIRIHVQHPLGNAARVKAAGIDLLVVRGNNTIGSVFAVVLFNVAPPAAFL